ncbi:MAG: cysteine desulfurase [Candidatus Berkelbacteria bacterium Gr01-1014_85]|uniref:Cysteine desulfurase n=1 Tax=Candidatus Berkelbacteria bacterium Gr01-1014_85 TaxID=2017150 RepID=A0A554JAY4_9BACT|nr:MAG: cysteine desulfurase [Candidatus Berkelbacteria bacterium Gr01-1014_85]
MSELEPTTTNPNQSGPWRDVYLDHAATTYLDPRVRAAMEPYFEQRFGNPSSLYRHGRVAKQALDQSRATLARLIGAESSELIFTGSGTESDNLAILGVWRAWQEHQSWQAKVSLARQGETAQYNTLLPEQPHFITSAIEHHAVLHVFQYLEKQGCPVTYLPVNAEGIVELASVTVALRPNTLLVSIMLANNEIGTLQPVAEISALLKKYTAEQGLKQRIYLHTDACQAAGALDLKVNQLGVDLMTINGSKIYGPKGVGLLYVRQGVKIKSIVFGGGQEKGLRSGTENLAAIVGFAKAFELIEAERQTENRRLTELRNWFWQELERRIAKVRLNGSLSQRLPNNLNVSILDIEGEALILYLDEVGIACATGSACDSATLDPSHVILALGVPYEFAHSSIRFSLGKRTSRTDLEYTLEHLVPLVEKLRRISPVRMELDSQSNQLSAPEAFVGERLPHWQAAPTSASKPAPAIETTAETATTLASAQNKSRE